MINNNTAIILSAGKGKRMGTAISKQYLEILGKPVIYYTIKAFEESKVDEIIIVCGKGEEHYIKEEIVDRYNIRKVKAIVEGGEERYNSVHNGLKAITESNIVLVHDGARPFIKAEEIDYIIEETEVNDACVAAVKTKDTVKIADEEGYVKETPDRRMVWNVQTPQAFKYSIIKEAYDNIIGKDATDINITDDAMVVELYNKDIKIKLIECSYENIKITTPDDMSMGEKILESRENRIK